MSSLRQKEGEFVLDHRASPGVDSEYVRRVERELHAQLPVVPEGALYETAIQTCSHCGAVVVMNPQRTRPRHYCAKCDHYVCDNPICVTDCQPIKRMLDQALTDLSKL
jgi:ribosomal protein S27AE